MYGKSAVTIRGDLDEAQLVGRLDDCGNCGERKLVFKADPSS
jgi:hypothetical protein